MARQTNININVNSTSAVKSIETLKKAFIGLNDTVQKTIGNSGKIKLELDLNGFDVNTLRTIDTTLRKLSKSVDALTKSANKYKRVGNQVLTVNTQLANNTRMLNRDLLSTVATFEFYRRGVLGIVKDYAELSKATYSVGVAGQMNLSQIDKLNESFLNLSTTVPSSAKELAKSVDGLIRTGRGYEESSRIIGQVAKLATASGDSLQDTAKVVTKVMVSLNVSGDRVKETLNTMHSTAIRTASDMGYLAESFKQVAGTASVLVSSSGLVGTELDDYKQKVLDLSMALSGSMANLGISASSAGTKIKNLFSRLIAVEKSAKMLFDNAMKINNIKVDGDEIFTFDKLSELTRKDLPRAVELLSKWYTEGKLSTQVMQKMFTGRHFNEISNALIQINGNVDTFINGIAKGVDYASDFDKNMFNINNQWSMLSNSITKLGQEIRPSEGYVGTLMLFNDVLKHINSNVVKTVGSFSTLAVNVGMTSLAVGALKTTLAPILKGSLLASLNPVSITLGVMAGTLYAIGETLLDTRKRVADVNTNFDNTKLLTSTLLKDIGVINGTVKTLKNNINEMSTIQIVSEDSVNLLNSVTDKTTGLKEALEEISNIKLLSSEEINKLSMSLDNISKEYDKKFTSMMKGYKETISNEIKEISKLGMMFGTTASSKSVERLLKYYIDLQEIQPDVQKRMESFYKKANELGIGKSASNKLLQVLDNSEPINKTREAMKKATEESNKFVTEGLSKYSEYQKSITEIQEAFNKFESVYNSYLSRLFKKTGSITFDGIDYSGFEGIVEIFKHSKLQEASSELSSIETKISSLKKEHEDLSKIDSSSEFYSGALKRKSKIEEEINKLLEQKKESLKYNEQLDNSLKKINSSMFEGYEYNEKTYQLAIDILETELKRNTAVQLGLINEKDRNDNYTKMKNVILENLEEENKEVVEKKNQTKYQIKYVNYLKENLDVELELAKIGKTKGEQESLIYSFKLKQLELEEEIAKKSLESARISVGNLKVEESLRNKIASIKTAKEGQDFIDDFYATHKNILTGELGEVDKNTYEVLKTVVSELAKVENIQGKIKLEPLKAIREYVDTIPTSITDSIKALQELSDKGLAPYKNYSKQMVEVTEKALIENKNKIWNAYNIDKDTTLAEAIESNMRNLDFARILGENITKNSSEIEKAFVGLKDKIKNNVELSKMYEEIDKNGTIEEKQAFYMKVLNGEHKDLLKHQKDSINNEKDKLELLKKELKLLSSMGDFLSSFGDIFQLKGLGDLGKAISGIKSFKEKEADLGKIEWSNIFDKEEMSKAFETALNNMQMGSAVGTAVGSMIGGGQSAQQGGALGGLLATGMNLTGWGAVGTAVGGALLGGLFDSSEKDKADAERRTKEANKLYNKNTEALQKLAQNMSNLSGGVDSLNNTLISAVSKIPTIDNISDVTESMTSMYKTMEKTRKFNNVAYQVTKTKSKKGFLGIGGSSTSWTETIELSVNDMLRRYGFYGAIEDMTSQQIRDFSKWLDNYSLGDSDNFGILADALEDYAEGLDKFEKNIENFFRDTTMEAFVGISSLEQESLRQQIEDFYKNLGFQIDDEMSKQIDKIAEEMSVMVTIMSDVRGEFLNQWMTTGQEAGSVFIKAMSPYIDAMLNNISQIYYDVYFSGINENLEKEFKNLSEQLVELKKQGNKLDWSTVTGKLSESFDKVLTAIINTKTETESFNDILMELQKQAFEAGLSLSEIFDLGLMSGTQKEVMDTFKDALLSSENDSALKSIGELLGDKIGETMANKMIDNLLSDRVLEFSTQIDKIMSGGTNLTFDSLAGLANQALSVGLMMQTEANRLEAIRELFSFDSDIEYTTQNENISYESGTSTQQIYNFYVSSSVEAGNVIESDSVERLADELLDIMLEKLKVDKGIDITKNY